MALEFKFRVEVDQSGSSNRVLLARNAGLEVTHHDDRYIYLLVADAEDGWGATGCEDRIYQALGIEHGRHSLKSPVQFLHAVESEDPGDFSWASTRAAEREREGKG